MNWLDLAIVAIIAVGLIKGLFDGFIKQVMSLLSLILAIFFAGKTARPVRNMLVSHDTITNLVSPHIITVVCYILAFILILLVFKWLSNLLNKIIKVTPISCLNYMLGGFLGAFFAVFFLSLVFNIITCIDSDSRIIKAHAKKESIFFYKVEKLVTFIAPLVKEGREIKRESPPVQEKQDKSG